MTSRHYFCLKLTLVVIIISTIQLLMVFVLLSWVLKFKWHKSFIVFMAALFFCPCKERSKKAWCCIYRIPNLGQCSYGGCLYCLVTKQSICQSIIAHLIHSGENFFALDKKNVFVRVKNTWHQDTWQLVCCFSIWRVQSIRNLLGTNQGCEDLYDSADWFKSKY